MARIGSMLQWRVAAALMIGLCFAPAAPADAGGSRTEARAVARRVFEEIFNQGRFEVADEIYASDFVNHGEKRDAGLKEDQEAARGWKAAFPDLRITVEMTIAEGDLVTVLWRGEGTNTGTGNGLPATGRRISGRGITIWRIVDGRIREEWSAYNELSLMSQLGLLPQPAK